MAAQALILALATVIIGALLFKAPFFVDSKQEDLILGAAEGDVAGMKAALAAGARVNATTAEFGDTALYMAVANDEREAVQFLMDRGASPDIKGRGGNAWVVVRSDEVRSILQKRARWSGIKGGP